MNLSKVFAFDENVVRTAGTLTEPLFVAGDVCRILDIQNPSDAVAGFSETEKGIAQIYTLGGPQEMLAVTEPGLYRLVFRSDKPAARKFQDWVFRDVLPEIRRTGQFSVERPEQLWDAFRQAKSAKVQLMILEAIGIKGPQAHEVISPAPQIAPQIIFEDLRDGVASGTIPLDYFKINPTMSWFDLYIWPQVLEELQASKPERYQDLLRCDFVSALKHSEIWASDSAQRIGPQKTPQRVLYFKVPANCGAPHEMCRHLQKACSQN